MKGLFFFVIGLLNFANGYAQFMDTYQPDSVYKLNHIRSRVIMFDHNNNKNCYVDNFDHNGRLIEHIQIDTSGKGFKVKTIFEYDDSGRLVKETEYIPKNKNKKDLLIFPMTFEYNQEGRFSKKIRTNANGKLNMVDSFTYSPHTLLSKYYDSSGNLMEQETLIFDRRQIEKKRTGFFVRGDTIKSHWDYDYLNYYDGSGKIMSRRVEYADFDAAYSPRSFYYRQIDYKYNAGGLLIKRISSDLPNNSGRKMILLFDYKFWD